MKGTLACLLLLFISLVCAYEKPTCSNKIFNMSPDQQCRRHGGRCYITDQHTGTGFCIQKVDCEMVGDAPDDMFCPMGYKCDYEKKFCVPLLRSNCQ